MSVAPEPTKITAPVIAIPLPKWCGPKEPRASGSSPPPSRKAKGGPKLEAMLRQTGCTMCERALNPGGKKPTADAASRKMLISMGMPDKSPVQTAKMPASAKKQECLPSRLPFERFREIVYVDISFGPSLSLIRPETKTIARGTTFAKPMSVLAFDADKVLSWVM